MLKPIDIHTHLSSKSFEEDRQEVIQRSFEVCDYVIDIGVDEDAKGHRRAQEFAQRHERAFFTAGIHPHDAQAQGDDEKLWEEFENCWTHPKCVAIGECGLDYYYDNSPREEQKKIFAKHIRKAEELELPLMIHTRDAEEDTKQLLESFSGSAVFHCFTSSYDLASFGVSKNFFISFSGIVTFKKSDELRETFSKLPLENILIETDSPYLAPVPMRGKRNESSFIQHTAKFLADLKNMPLEDFLRVTRENTFRAFPKIKQ